MIDNGLMSANYCGRCPVCQVQFRFRPAPVVEVYARGCASMALAGLVKIGLRVEGNSAVDRAGFRSA